MKKIFNNSWFTLLSVVLAVILGFVANWTAWAWLLIYAILWVAYADKEL